MSNTANTNNPDAMSIRRIPFLDMLRGIAVLGILVMNIQAFSQVELAYVSPGIHDALSTLDRFAHALGYLLVDQKFVSLFSMMFGVSSWIVAANAQANQQSMVRLHVRRNISLLLIGLAHAYLIWNGDILVSYALAGLLITRALHWPMRKQLTVGLVFLMIPMLMSLLEVFLIPAGERAEVYLSEYGDMASEVEALRGDWLSVQAWRFQSTLKMHLLGIPFMTLWFSGGWMLIGMVLFRLGIVRATFSQGFYFRWSAAWLVPGLLVTLAGYAYQARYDFDLSTVALGRGVIGYFGALMMALGYLGVAVLFYQRGVWPWVNRMLQYVGRMALTNYLLQSLIATSVFYGYGLGLFERLSLAELIPVTLGVWAVNVLMSLAWLSVFRYGPAEWLWRWMTRGRRPALLR